jgi:curved DNA-binding protein CbpA
MDPYTELGVDPGASAATIAQAHRRLAKRYHPDLNPGPEAAARMRRINEAWRILSDPRRRASHDAGQTASTWPRGQWMSADTAAWAAGRAFTAEAPRSRRPPRAEPPPETFGDQPWVMLVVMIGLASLVFIGSYLGSLAR